MTPPPAPSPHPSTGPSVAWLVADSVIGPTDGPADPSTFVQARVDLFMRDYDEHRGVVSSISGGDGAAPKRGVDSIPRPSPARAPSSPKRSRISSPRRVLAATAGAVVRAVSRPDDRSDGRASVDHPPSPPRRTRSPADVIAGAFAPPPQPSKRSSNGFAFLGLVPKSAFLNWMRSSIKNNYEGLASSHLKREINNRRSMILYHFSKVGKLSESAESDGRSGPTLRSDVSDDADDWVLDMDAATCAVTNVRRLDRYPIEMLLTLRRGTKLLLLVNVSDDAKLLLSKGAKVDELQRLPKRIIAGREYFQLRCSMEDVSANDALTRADPDDAAAERLFQSDFKGGRKGFIVRFDGTPYQHHFRGSTSSVVLPATCSSGHLSHNRVRTIPSSGTSVSKRHNSNFYSTTTNWRGA